jgi:hypothetical protein
MFKMSDGMTDMLEEEGRPSKVHLSSIQMAAMQKTDKVTQAAYMKAMQKEASDGTTASYYELPEDATELQDLISAKNMNAQIGEIFRECYRYGQASHSDEIRGIKKILFYAKAELERLQVYGVDV